MRRRWLVKEIIQIDYQEVVKLQRDLLDLKAADAKSFHQP
jgi:hypothetical protein